MEKLGFVIDESVRFGVCLGDRGEMQCQGLCRGSRVDLGTYNVSITGHLFELGGVDVVLGVDWLRSLGEVMLDWSKMRMRFTEGGHTVELTGDPTLQRSMGSLKSICNIAEIDFSAAYSRLIVSTRETNHS
ncbi:hypothetical protein F511_36962 [Dorcoceras hygrometricum]|uniref:Uncharacterized protein n=1 Tax=Dorcoceras hygrometricum TaxID=472368 RepID=A0A2Z7AZ14_9LAMI|nr:hypothetical protein F511_36962 [Dorcoceras hygrometricum]